MFFILKLLDYNIIFINLILIALIAILLLIINFLIRQKNNKWEINIQKYAAYECGFEPFSETQAQVFEIQFFLVSIMFLIFDVELALMFPWAVHIAFLGISSFWVMVTFLLLLTLGFMYEWVKGALNWHSIQSSSSSTILIANCLPLTIIKTSIYGINTTSITMEMFMAAILLFLLLFGTIINFRYPANNYLLSIKIRNLCYYGLQLVFILYFFELIFGVSTKPTLFFHNYFIADFYTHTVKLFLISTLLILFLLTKNYLLYHKYIIWELPIILFLASFFMFLMISSFNLFSLFVSLEGLSLCLYILAAYDFDRRTSAEAALKYFTLGTLSSGVLLLGLVFIYITVGSLDFLIIFQKTNNFSNDTFLRIGSCLIFFSFIFKLGAWPCHQWVPDVYQGAPTIITAFFAVTVKSAIFFTVLRLFNYIIIEKILLSIICIMSLIIGILGALKATKIKRFLAYAAINQMGFLLLGIFVEATSAVIIYFIFYIITNIMIFIIILKTINIDIHSSILEITFLTDLRTFIFDNKHLVIYLLIILFSMAGLPPFITSFAKWYILFIISTQNYLFILLITILLTALSIYYYVRLVKNIFFEDIKLSADSYQNKFSCLLQEQHFLLWSLSSILIFGIVPFYYYFIELTRFILAVAEVCNLTIL